MGNYNVLDEVRAVASQHELENPDCITYDEWAAATPETKSLMIKVEDLVKTLEDVYWEAVRQRDWERAYLTLQRLVSSACLLSINGEVYAEKKCKDREDEYITRAKEWVHDVTELLG